MTVTFVTCDKTKAVFKKEGVFDFLKTQSKCFERNTRYTSFKPVVTCYCLFSVSVTPEKNYFHSVKDVIHCFEVNGESPLDFNGLGVPLAMTKNILELIALLPLGHFNLNFRIRKDESCKTHS